jgi:hypothetical protein
MLRTMLITLAITAVLPATAVDAQAKGWATLSAGLTMEYDPASRNACNAGRPACVDEVIDEMRRRYAPLAFSCDHDAIFALAYLRTTEAYRRAIDDPGFFADTPFVNHEDALFADFYFDAYDAWLAGDRAATPAAWEIAFGAADRREVSAAGNLLLGINAHVQRDLPYVLAGVGLVKPDGTSRKPDHDKVNQILAQVYPPLLEEIAREYDPTIDDTDLPTNLDGDVLFQTVVGWREIAWRNAERLAAASTAEDRETVSRSIEAYAASQAEAIRLGTAYVAPLQSSAARDAYCAARR